MTKKTYICGELTGLPVGDVIARFRAAAHKLRQAGFEPVSPLDDGLPFEADWAARTGRNITAMLRCNGVYLLRGWRQSESAAIEYLVARQRRMTILHEQTSEPLATDSGMLADSARAATGTDRRKEPAAK